MLWGYVVGFTPDASTVNFEQPLGRCCPAAVGVQNGNAIGDYVFQPAVLVIIRVVNSHRKVFRESHDVTIRICLCIGIRQENFIVRNHFVEVYPNARLIHGNIEGKVVNER